MNRRDILRSGGFVSAVALLGQRVFTSSAHDDGTPEASPDASGIPPITWNLVSIDSGDDSKTPDKDLVYSIQFLPSGDLNIQGNCNGGGGTYTIDGQNLSIPTAFSTLIACAEPNIDTLFWASLNKVTAWQISSDGSDQLVLTIGPNDEKMTFAAGLTGVVWQWQQFAGGPDQNYMPDAPDRYTIEFKTDDSIVVHADCNSGKGNAIVDGNEIDLTVAMTRKACGEGSYFDKYFEILDTASSFVITSGNLYLNLPMDGGGAVFKATIADRSHDEATPTS